VERGGHKLGAFSGSLTADKQWEEYRWFLYPHEAAGFLLGQQMVTPRSPFTVASTFSTGAPLPISLDKLLPSLAQPPSALAGSHEFSGLFMQLRC
jgi:hypothetical protein